jgi:hypothetical protein
MWKYIAYIQINVWAGVFQIINTQPVENFFNMHGQNTTFCEISGFQDKERSEWPSASHKDSGF